MVSHVTPLLGFDQHVRIGGCRVCRGQLKAGKTSLAWIRG